MYKKGNIALLNFLSPVHTGSGQDLGIVDQPVQRERHTNYPKIEASGIKGCFRAYFDSRSEKKDRVETLFGPEPNSNDNDYAGSLGFSDARIFLFPVKSVKGVFAYTTSVDVLNKFIDNYNSLYNKKLDKIDINIEEGKCLVLNDDLKIDKNIILEEYTFKCENIDNDNLSDLIKLKEINDFKDKLVILSDNDFSDFVDMSTEVITRTRIDPDTGTVKQGALFTEEYLPAETIMYSNIFYSPSFKNGDDHDEKDIEDEFKKNKPEIIQLGGNQNLGKGMVKIDILEVK